MAEKPPERAVLYVDGNNWYHHVIEAGVKNPFDLSYVAITRKLIGSRDWRETRYYIGALKQQTDPKRYADQRRFLDKISNEDPRVTVHRGRIELRPQKNPATPKLLQLIDNQTLVMPEETRKRLRLVVEYYREIQVEKEKAVDVMIARDVIVGALLDDAYDVAYLLSADGDFSPVVETVMGHGKKVICASPGFSSHLEKTAHAFVTLNKAWFSDCYL